MTTDLSTLERALLTRVADDGDFRILFDRGFTDRHFTDETTVAAFNALLHHFRAKTTNGATMSLELLASQVPAFEPVDLKDSAQSLCTVLEEGHYRTIISDLGMELARVASSAQDPRVATEVIRRKVVQLQALEKPESQDCIMSEAMYDILDEYTAVKSQDQLLGIPFPWNALNDETLGMQPGQVFLFYARPKNMKTFLALKIAADAYKHSRKRVLFITKEMTVKEIRTRAAALLAEVPFQGVRKGNLSTEHETIFIDAVLRLPKHDQMKRGESKSPYLQICSTDPRQGLAGIDAKIEEHDPDLVVIDGIYFFVNSKGRQQRWEATTDLTQATKVMAQERNIPLIITMKANKEAENSLGKNTGEIAHSDSFGFDVDYAFRIIKTDYMPVLNEAGEITRRRTELMLICPASRDSIMENFVVAFEPCTDFAEVGPISQAQVAERLKLSQTQEEEALKERTGGRTTKHVQTNKRTAASRGKSIRRSLKGYKPNR